MLKHLGSQQTAELQSALAKWRLQLRPEEGVGDCGKFSFQKPLGYREQWTQGDTSFRGLWGG